MKRNVAVCFLALFAFLLAPALLAQPDSTLTAKAVTSRFYFNGERVKPQLYSVDGDLFVNIRDMAQMANFTSSQFSLSFDEAAKVVNAATEKSYIPAGGELTGKAAKSPTCSPSPWKLKVNGVFVPVKAYTIAGNEFFRLRDLGKALGFIVRGETSGKTVSVFSGGYSLVFNAGKFVPRIHTLANGETIKYRSYENVVYAANPLNPVQQCMNIYIPEAYFQENSIGRFDAQTAPIFLPNASGGYMQASIRTLYNVNRKTGALSDSIMAAALSKGYVVVSPALRGHNTPDILGRRIGVAPAAIVDLKAAVRFLRYNDAAMPGSAERIISDGGSAGGAISALLGTSGNSPLYQPYLDEIGAADGRDDIFAAFVFCPILDVENIGMGYEWFFSGTGLTVYDGMSTWNKPGVMTEGEKLLSQELAKMYPAYINSLGLKDPETGKPVGLDADGTGAFKDYIASVLKVSAQKYLDSGKDIDNKAFNNALTIQDGKVLDVDLDKYLASIHRLKGASCLDNGFIPYGTDGGFVITNESKLYSVRKGIVHFDPSLKTAIDRANARGATYTGDFTVSDDVKQLTYLMNPIKFLDNSASKTAPNFYCCAGAKDNDVSMFTAALLYLGLASTNECDNLTLNFAWGQRHGGDYDWEDMFAWLDTITSE